MTTTDIMHDSKQVPIGCCGGPCGGNTSHLNGLALFIPTGRFRYVLSLRCAYAFARRNPPGLHIATRPDTPQAPRPPRSSCRRSCMARACHQSAASLNLDSTTSAVHAMQVAEVYWSTHAVRSGIVARAACRAASTNGTLARGRAVWMSGRSMCRWRGPQAWRAHASASLRSSSLRRTSVTLLRWPLQHQE